MLKMHELKYKGIYNSFELVVDLELHIYTLLHFVVVGGNAIVITLYRYIGVSGEGNTPYHIVCERLCLYVGVFYMGIYVVGVL